MNRNKEIDTIITKVYNELEQAKIKQKPTPYSGYIYSTDGWQNSQSIAQSTHEQHITAHVQSLQGQSLYNINTTSYPQWQSSQSLINTGIGSTSAQQAVLNSAQAQSTFSNLQNTIRYYNNE